jgi:hypothetical protein
LICERLDQANFILPVFFRLLPGSPFAYWVSPSVLAIPKNTKRFEADGREVRQGLATSDDFRFVRAQWEVSSEAVGAHAIWMPFAKGGESAAFYSDIHLLILWHNDGLEMKRFAADRWGSASRTIKSVDRYFESGLTYTSYTLLGFSPRVLPAGCVFSVAGMHIFLPNNDPWYCLGFLTSSFVRYFLSLITDGRKFEAGYVKSIPFLNEAQAGNEGLEIVRLTRACYDALRQRDARNETSHLFYLPPFVENSHKVNRNDGDLATARHSIDRSVLNLFGLTEREISANSPGLNGDSMVELDAEALLGLSEAVDSQDLRLVQTRDLLSWIVGAVWGRWDIQFGTGEKSVPKLPDPFAPLPVCPPGQLQNTQGLPITKEEVERLNDEGSWNYPIQIPWEGIIVDDPGHRLDIETRAHQVLEAISKDHLKDFERDACEILGVRTLRDYFRKPASFFADHLRRYSKSRRQAPIYWPLSTRSGSYTIWIYYHRLTNQTLFTCINEYVDPKLRDIRDTLSKLRSKGTGRSSIEEKELERLHEFELELQEFRDELLRLAELQWSPNLNDGVQITAAPLWKLFRLSKWQKTLKETWESLDRGDHDWAHLAYTLWPDRVREKCKTDKSLAIAHGLEQLYVEPPLAAKKNRKGKPAMEEVLEMEEE